MRHDQFDATRIIRGDGRQRDQLFGKAQGGIHVG
jgi:hypothetical protein